MRVRVGVDCHESHVDNEKDTVQRGGDGEGEGRGEKYGEEEGVVAEAAECWKENPHENGVGLEKRKPNPQTWHRQPLHTWRRRPSGLHTVTSYRIGSET